MRRVSSRTAECARAYLAAKPTKFVQVLLAESCTDEYGQTTAELDEPTLMTPSRMAIVAGMAPLVRMMASTLRAVSTFWG